MKKTFEEEDDLKELLDLEMLKEAQKLEEELLSGEDLDELNISDDDIQASFEKLMQRLKNEDEIRPDAEATGESVLEDELADEVENSGKSEDKVVNIAHFSDSRNIRRKCSSAGKVAGFMIAILLTVFAGSMTSEANRQYLIQQIRILRGDNSLIVVSNDENADQSIRDEADAVHEIENTLKVEIPNFYYRPYVLKYDTFFINEELGYAYIQFKNTKNNTNFVLTVYKRTEDKASFTSNSHGDKTIKLPEQGIEFLVREILNVDSDDEYDATWMYRDGVYKLRGRLSWEEFEKMLKGMQYNE